MIHDFADVPQIYCIIFLWQSHSQFLNKYSTYRDIDSYAFYMHLFKVRCSWLAVTYSVCQHIIRTNYVQLIKKSPRTILLEPGAAKQWMAWPSSTLLAMSLSCGMKLVSFWSLFWTPRHSFNVECAGVALLRQNRIIGQHSNITRPSSAKQGGKAATTPVSLMPEQVHLLLLRGYTSNIIIITGYVFAGFAVWSSRHRLVFRRGALLCAFHKTSAML